MSQSLWAFGTAFIVALYIQPLMIYFLRKYSVIDVPGERSSHTIPTPRGGGVAVVTGILIGSLVAMRDSLTVGVLVTVLLMFLLGIIEDIRGTSQKVRFALQFVCAIPVVLASAYWAGWWLIPALLVGMLFVAMTVNAVNFMDGINGITGLFGIVCGLYFAWLFAADGSDLLTWVSLAVVGASLAFLPFNAFKARVFLGDSGSYGLGAAVSGLALTGLATGLPAVVVIAPLVIYAGDTSWTLISRIRRGENWHQAHRSHVYQRLVQSGYPHWFVSLLVSGFIAMCCGIGILLVLDIASGVLAVFGLVVVALVYLLLPRLLSPTQQPEVAKSSSTKMNEE